MDYEFQSVEWSGLESWAQVKDGGDIQSHLGIRIWVLMKNPGVLQGLKGTGKVEIDYFSEAEGWG